MRKTHWGVTAVAVAAVTILAGCASTSGDTGTSDGPVTLTYWDFIDPSQDNARSKALQENIADFEKANPNITVKLSVVSYGDMLSRLPQAAAAGQTPDVIKMYSPLVPQLAAAQVYQPLPDQLTKIDDWLLPVKDLAGSDGKQVAVPYEYRTCTLLYNQKILDQIGASVPTTWNQVAEVAGKASAAGYTGFGTGFSDVDNSAIISEFFDCFMSEVGQPISGKDGKADFATSKGEQFADFLTTLKRAGGMSSNVVADQYSTVTDGLSNGTVAMGVVGTHRIVTVESANPDIKWTSLPAAADGSTTGTTFGWTLGIGSGSQHVAAAAKFIDYMTSPTAAAKMATGGEVPTREASYKESYFSTPEAKTVLDIRDYVEKHSKPRAYPENWLAIATGLANAGQELYLNGTSASDFMKNAQDAANK